jgi:hypothetical protein
MAPRYWLPVLVALALEMGPARSADLAYPPGSRIGLAAPAGMVESKGFFGFEDRQNSVAIILVALPPEAFTDLDKTVTADALKRQGVALESREAMPFGAGKAFLVIGQQEIEKTKVRKWILIASTPTLTALVTVQMPETARSVYPDATVRAALATVAIRAVVPTEEQLGLLPFKVGDLAGFRVGGVMPGRAIMLSDATADAAGAAVKVPHMLVAVAPGGPAQATERDTFAREVFGTVPNLKEIRITGSESLRMAGQQGHQILASAKDPAGTPVTVVQWLRFGGGGYLQMVGTAPVDGWRAAYPRFRAVRDGIDRR